MDADEARRILKDELSELRGRTYEALRASLLNEPRTSEVVGKSGTRYQLEAQAVWDGAPEGDLRVVVSVDDGGWRAFKPLTEAFIIAPDGTFVGE